MRQTVKLSIQKTCIYMMLFLRIFDLTEMEKAASRHHERMGARK